jgi:hypothetical protein
VTEAALPLLARCWLAIVCALRILFDPGLARRIQRVVSGGSEAHELPPAGDAAQSRTAARGEPPDPGAPARVDASAAVRDGALGLLSLFQREGRLVDFLEQEIDQFGDAEIGAATRVVHAGCRKSLLAHFDIVRVRTEAEGAAITIPEGFDGQSVKLVGNVRGAAPYRGVLRHGGWRANAVRLPEKVAGHDASIIVPAEVEL